ncbi:type III polyketide synthase [Shimazuella sp. AN120528]|uniref:type III polyketide synthase n=1 Tax=Shimazuella soli TaxID=1892854 RepID=UPI001F0E5ABC|nr:3-oxoacyl-[acyl-carrier-protein] synthase III C-terminal domain-containing protein [Shimazuella soli]MCH5585687.1 type III polyketide synthase [Shimazuella soli]
MSKIVAVGTAVPPYELSQSDAKAFAEELFGGSLEQMDRMMTIFENTAIEKRYISCPPDWFSRRHTFPERNEKYTQMTCQLAEDAIRQCLEQSNTHPKQIDHIYFVSTTGIATPSIDAHLINQLGLSTHIKRTPIWGLGCAGGVSGLSRAYEFAKSYPDSRVLFVAVELCSLTYRPQDNSKSNFVATSLFGDGAAAVLVVGENVIPNRNGPTIVDSMSTIWPDSLDVMGWEVVDDGLKVIFSRDIPSIVHEQVKPVVDTFLAKCEIKLEDITYMISHPGGKKVLEAYESALQLSKDKFIYAYDVLKYFGNMSSVTVLFVLQQVLQTNPTSGYGLMTALGPGFSSELLLLDWNGGVSI